MATTSTVGVAGGSTIAIGTTTSIVSEKINLLIFSKKLFEAIMVTMVLKKIKVFFFGVKVSVGGIVVLVVFSVDKCLGAELVLLGHDDCGRVEYEKRR